MRKEQPSKGMNGFGLRSLTKGKVAMVVLRPSGFPDLPAGLRKNLTKTSNPVLFSRFRKDFRSPLNHRNPSLKKGTSVKNRFSEEIKTESRVPSTSVKRKPVGNFPLRVVIGLSGAFFPWIGLETWEPRIFPFFVKKKNRSRLPGYFHKKTVDRRLTDSGSGG